MSNWCKSISVDGLVAEIKAIDNRIAEASKRYSVWYADLLQRRIACVDELDVRGEPISDYTKRRRRFPEKMKESLTEGPGGQPFDKSRSTKMLPIVDESNLSRIRRVMVEIIEKYSSKSRHGTCPVSKIRYELPRRCKRELQRDIGYYIAEAKEAGIIDVFGSESRQVCRVVPEEERERRFEEITEEAHKAALKAEEAARKAEASGGNTWGAE